MADRRWEASNKALELQRSLANCDTTEGSMFSVTFSGARPSMDAMQSYSTDIKAVSYPREPHHKERAWIVQLTGTADVPYVERQLRGIRFGNSSVTVERCNMVERLSNRYRPEHINPYVIDVDRIPPMARERVVEKFVGYRRMWVMTNLDDFSNQALVYYDTSTEALAGFRLAYDWRAGNSSLIVRFQEVGYTVFALKIKFSTFTNNIQYQICRWAVFVSLAFT